MEIKNVPLFSSALFLMFCETHSLASAIRRRNEDKLNAKTENQIHIHITQQITN